MHWSYIPSAATINLWFLWDILLLFVYDCRAIFPVLSGDPLIPHRCPCVDGLCRLDGRPEGSWCPAHFQGPVACRSHHQHKGIYWGHRTSDVGPCVRVCTCHICIHKCAHTGTHLIQYESYPGSNLVTTMGLKKCLIQIHSAESSTLPLRITIHYYIEGHWRLSAKRKIFQLGNVVAYLPANDGGEGGGGIENPSVEIRGSCHRLHIKGLPILVKWYQGPEGNE